MAKHPRPEPEVLRQLLDYDPATGKLFWKFRPREMFTSKRGFSTWNSRFGGKEAFTANGGHGYPVGNVNYYLVAAHRVIWALVYGEWPEGDVDHINMVPTDNRLTNLRAATRSENMMNTARRADNTSGYKGVSWHAQYGKWEARINRDKKVYRLGYFDTAEAGHDAYCRAAANLHGEFARVA